jgi:hypothetical protein
MTRIDRAEIHCAELSAKLTSLLMRMDIHENVGKELRAEAGALADDLAKERLRIATLRAPRQDNRMRHVRAALRGVAA